MEIVLNASPQRQTIGTQPGSLVAIIQNFKSVSTRKFNQWIRKQGIGDLTPRRIWQRNYYEHIIRNQKELDAIREYIYDNPRRWTEDKEYRE